MILLPVQKNVDCSEEIERIIDLANPYETICFQTGSYFINKRINVKNKKHLRISGNNTTIVSFFDAALGSENYSGVFAFDDCEDLTIENLCFDTSCPSNASGKIISKDVTNNTINVELYDGNVMDGYQKIRAINSMDADGTPDYILATYKESDYEVIDKSTIRVWLPENCNIENIPIDEQICFRHGFGGYKNLSNATITFRNCSNVTMKDINVYSSVGYMTVVFPRCHNFTFIRFNVVPKKDSNHLMASNVDAIHLFGLTGTLMVFDCCFSGLGDDAVNIHSTAGHIKKIENGLINIENKRFNCQVEKEWCSKGDLINVYDASFLYKGSLIVDEYEESHISYSNCNCQIEEGDFVANTAYFAKTIISNCEIKNSRARGLLLQTENIEIKNCRFYGISLSAILLSPDIRSWQEMGPVKNVIIENCSFEKCAIESSNNGNSVISVKTSHDKNDINSNLIHDNINILNNTFIDCDRLLSICSTDGIHIKGNKTIVHGEEYVVDKDNLEVKLQNCKNCNVEGEII